MILSQVLFIDFFKVVEIERAFGVDTFVYHEMFPGLVVDEGMAAVGAAQVQGRETVAFFGREACTAYLAEELSFAAIILVKIDGRGLASGTGAVFRDAWIRTA